MLKKRVGQSANSVRGDFSPFSVCARECHASLLSVWFRIQTGMEFRVEN